MDTRVKELLKRKGSSVVTIDRSEAVSTAVGLMVANRVGSVVVIDDAGVCGIFSERDCVARVVLEHRDPRETPIGEVMSQVPSASLDQTVERCMETMTEQRCRHLPVLESGKLVGIVSIGDCVAHLCDEATRENGYLRDYIGGHYPS